VNRTCISSLIDTAIRIVAGAFLVFAVACRADAGPVPPSTEVELDAATWVVVGPITKIDESKVPQRDATVRQGLATVDVKEVLKGTAVKTIEFPVFLKDLLVRRRGEGAERLRAEVLHVREVGQSGIWIIRGGDDVSSRSAVFVRAAQEPDVRRILQALKEPKWSEPAGGLRAWALAVGQFKSWAPRAGVRSTRSDCSDDDLPGVIFAVNNVSKEDIYLPLPQYGRAKPDATPGFFAATATSKTGKQFAVLLDVEHPQAKPLACLKLSPGETTYLHPDCSRFGVDWREKLTPGTYSLVVTYKNDRTDGEVPDRSFPPPVTAWTGQLTTPPLEFVLTAEDVRGWKDLRPAVPKSHEAP